LREKRDADRIKAVLLLGTGWSVSQVAKVLLMDPNTVRTYHRLFSEGGIETLLTRHHLGGFTYLAAAEEAELTTHLEKELHLTAKSVAAYIKKRWQVNYSSRGVVALLHRLGFCYKKPKLIPGKADAEAQEAFLEEYKKLKENKGKADEILFMDATHPHHNPVVACGWIKKGHEFELRSNTGRQRLNINGVINIQNLDAVTRFDDSINAESTIALFQQIEKHYPKAKKLHIICDNARYYRSRKVSEYLETSKIELCFLPPYSPNLNLIERYWKYFKKTLLYNRYYETFSEFKQACENFFANAKDHAVALKSLLTENFHIIGKIQN